MNALDTALPWWKSRVLIGVLLSAVF